MKSRNMTFALGLLIALVFCTSCNGTRQIERKATKELPAYTILMTNKTSGTHMIGMDGFLYLPCREKRPLRCANQLPLKSAEQFARVTLYSTEEAFRADNSKSFDRDALRKGSLGMVTLGPNGISEFYTGEMLFP